MPSRNDKQAILMRGNENGETRGYCEPRGSNREGFLVEVMSSWGPGGQEASDRLGSGRRVSNSRDRSWRQEEKDMGHQGPGVSIRS